MRALLATLLVLALAPAAQAQASSVSIGISDQHWSALIDPLADWLGFERARVIAPWDVALHESRAFDDWLQWAAWSGREPLVSFGSGRDCRAAPCPLPTAAEYEEAFRAFHERWPEVTDVSIWNEGNHPSQPTADHPEAAAGYYRAAVSVCPQCRILAAEPVDIPGMTTWLARFQRALGTRPRLWGLHNYGDVARRRDSATRAMLETVDGEVWITETGGLVYFELPSGEVRWPADEERARASIEYAFELADAHADRIPRLYLYNLKEAPGSRWDSGLLSPAGRLRPSFWAVAARMRPLAPPPPPEVVGTPQTRSGGRARIVRRPRFDRRRGLVRARLRCPRGPKVRCYVAMQVRARAAGGRRSRLGPVSRMLRPGRSHELRIRVPRRHLKRIRAGRTRLLLTEVWVDGERPLRYRVRCARRS